MNFSLRDGRVPVLRSFANLLTNVSDDGGRANCLSHDGTSRLSTEILLSR
jgi:hypothetical protein